MSFLSDFVSFVGFSKRKDSLPSTATKTTIAGVPKFAHKICKYSINFVPCAKYSENKNEHHKSKVIICGGYQPNESYLHELDTSAENSKTVHNLNINLKTIGCHYGCGIIALLTKDNKNLITIKPMSGLYNVYDFNSKQWLLKKRRTRKSENSKNSKTNKSFDHRLDIFHLKGIGYKSLFIDDNILIISHKNKLYFYNLDDILNPRKFCEYKIVNKIPNQKNNGYVHHGMCLIDYQFIKNERENICNVFLTVLLFGGQDNVPFESTFTKFDIIIAVNSNSNSNNNSNSNKKMCVASKIKEEKIIDMNLFEVKQNMLDLCYFACHCVRNKDNEIVIVIIGGISDSVYDTGDSIFLYNVNQNTMIAKEGV